jgi:outer membrane cobalamin receptor
VLYSNAIVGDSRFAGSGVILMTNGVRYKIKNGELNMHQIWSNALAEKFYIGKGANALEFGGDAIGGVIVEPNRIILKA